jgi:hypothetical protein
MGRHHWIGCFRGNRNLLLAWPAVLASRLDPVEALRHESLRQVLRFLGVIFRNFPAFDPFTRVVPREGMIEHAGVGAL